MSSGSWLAYGAGLAGVRDEPDLAGDVVVLVEGLAVILNTIKAYAWQASAAILFVVLCGVGFKLVRATLDLSTARTALATEQRDRANENTERMRVALEDARETFRKGEIHARNQQEIADAHAAQEKRRLARLAAAAADGERLRDQVRTYAATCGGGEADSPAAALQHCRDRAAALGKLLGEADGLAEAFAGAAEQHADEVRTLKRVIENDRALLPPPGGVGLKPPPLPIATHNES